MHTGSKAAVSFAVSESGSHSSWYCGWLSGTYSTLLDVLDRKTNAGIWQGGIILSWWISSFYAGNKSSVSFIFSYTYSAQMSIYLRIPVQDLNIWRLVWGSDKSEPLVSMTGSRREDNIYLHSTDEARVPTKGASSRCSGAERGFDLQCKAIQCSHYTSQG